MGSMKQGDCWSLGIMEVPEDLLRKQDNFCSHYAATNVHLRYCICTLLHNFLEAEGIAWKILETRESGYMLPKGVTALNWHHDGGASTPDIWIAMWSNIQPTLIKSSFRDEEEYRFPEGSVIIIKNRNILHKPPDKIDPKRVFMRAYDLTFKNAKRKEER